MLFLNYTKMNNIYLQMDIIIYYNIIIIFINKKTANKLTEVISTNYSIIGNKTT